MKNKILLMVVFLLGIFASLGFVSAAPVADSLDASDVTIVVPAASSIMQDTIVWNVTISNNSWNGVPGDSQGQNWTRAYFWVASASLAEGNTTSQIHGPDIFNETSEFEMGSGTLSFNGTINTADFQDSNDYTLIFELRNGSNSVNVSLTGLTIDNSVPVTPTNLFPSDLSVQQSRVIDFSSTVDSTSTTSCTLRFVGTNPGQSSYAMTHSGNVCFVRVGGISFAKHEYFIRASDETNTTDSATISFRFPAEGSGKKIVENASEHLTAPPQGKMGRTQVIVWVIVIIVIVLVVVRLRSKK